MFRKCQCLSKPARVKLESPVGTRTFSFGAGFLSSGRGGFFQFWSVFSALFGFALVFLLLFLLQTRKLRVQTRCSRAVCWDSQTLRQFGSSARLVSLKKTKIQSNNPRIIRTYSFVRTSTLFFCNSQPNDKPKTLNFAHTRAPTNTSQNAIHNDLRCNRDKPPPPLATDSE